MHLLFDLDGTLTDSRPGVIRCFRHALAALGHPERDDDAFVPFLGPPLAVSFAELLGTKDGDVIEAAVAAFRERFERIGMFENAVFPGIAEALDVLDAAGHDLHVVTVKPHPYARRILEYFGLANRFHTVTGAELNDRHYSKAALIAASCSGSNLSAERTVMVGDRSDDIVGARRCGLRAIGVTWGYGSRSELEAAGVDALVDTTEALVSLIATLSPRLPADSPASPR